MGDLPDKVRTASLSPSLLSTLGWHGELRLFTIDDIAKLTVGLVLGFVS